MLSLRTSLILARTGHLGQFDYYKDSIYFDIWVCAWRLEISSDRFLVYSSSPPYTIVTRDIFDCTLAETFWIVS